MYYYHVDVKAGQTFSYPVEDTHTAGIFVMSGEMKVLNQAVANGAIVEFKQDGNTIAVKGVTDASFIAFGGQPINEKVVSYGPFVMNDFKEIQQAIEDYETGKMGELAY
jgi:hypothetical protein